MNTRPLCVDICEDGLRCAPEWPHCANTHLCTQERHCFWRAFHQIPSNQMRATESSAQCALPL